MSNKDYKEVVIDNDAIVNTEPKELPEEAHNIPQGVKPHLNPNPGYGEDGETKPAIKTDLVEGERGTPVDVVTPAKESFKTVQEVYNFLNGLKIKGKNIEDYIDDKGGVTEEELDAALTKYQKIVRAKHGQPTTQDVIDKLKTGEYLLIYENSNNKPNIFVPAQSSAHIYLFSILAESVSDLTVYSISVESLNTTANFNTFINSAGNYKPISANPTLAGTENELTSLKVGNYKYKVPGGTKLYKHVVSGFSGGTPSTAKTIQMITMSDTRIDESNLMTTKGLLVSGYDYYVNYAGPIGPVEPGLAIQVYSVIASIQNSSLTVSSQLSDTVTEL